MLQVLRPTSSDVLRVQEQTGAPYWSLVAADALRAVGLVSVEEVARDELTPAGVVVVPRDATVDDATWARLSQATVILETPLHLEVARRLGVVARTTSPASVTVTGLPRGRRPHTLERPAAPVELAADPSWGGGPLPWTDLGWDAVAGTECQGDDGATGALLQRSGRCFALTVPLFDVLGRWAAHPPIADRAHVADNRATSPYQVLAALLPLLVELVAATGAPAVVADPFPDGTTSSLTIRHDHDRPVAQEAWDALLGFYAAHGLRASFGFLSYLLPRDRLAELVDRGHEVQLHSFARDLHGFQGELRALRQAGGAPVVGCTIHGGPSSPGFVGDRQLRWAEASGLAYAETVGHRSGSVLPVVRLDGTPYRSPLVATPEHHGLDASTRPEDHRLELLQQRIPAQLARGEVTIVMNHPDVHGSELRALLRSLDLAGVFCGTMEDVTSFRSTTRFGATVALESGAVRVRVPAPLRHPAGFTVTWSPGREVRGVLAPGATSLVLPREDA